MSAGFPLAEIGVDEAAAEIERTARGVSLPRGLRKKVAALLESEPHLPWDTALARIVQPT